MKRLNRLLTLALVLSAFPATLVTAQPAPAGVELSAAPVTLATATVPTVQAPQVELQHVNEVVLPAPSWNPADWFLDALALGAVIAALVALLKANVLKIQGLATLAVSFGLGIGISLLGTLPLPFFGRLNPLAGADAIMFGVNAAVYASGGWDFIKGVIVAALGGKSRGATGAST